MALRKNQMTAIFLLAVLCANLLAGCGDAALNAEDASSNFLSAYTAADDLELDEITGTCSTPGTLYVWGHVFEETGRMDRLYKRDWDEKTAAEIALPQLSGNEKDYNLISLAFSQSGENYWAIYTAEDVSEVQLLFCDLSGSVLFSVFMDTDLEIHGTAVDSEGNLWIAVGEDLLCYDSQGNAGNPIPLEGLDVVGMTVSGSGTVIISGQNTGTSCIGKLEDGKVKQFETEIDCRAVYPCGGDQILLCGSAQLYKMDVQTGETDVLLSWSNIGVSDIIGAAADGTGNILVLVQQYTRSTNHVTYEWGTLTKAEDIPERTEITLGMTTSNTELEEAVTQYNRSSSTCQIAIVNFTPSQLDLEIASGDCPDMIFADSATIRKYAAALADLTTLMDDTLSADDVLTVPMQAFRSGEVLSALPISFQLGVLLSSTALVGDLENWSMETLCSTVSSLEEDATARKGYDQTAFLEWMLELNAAEYVNYEASSCSFECDSFLYLLETAAGLPKTYDFENDGHYSSAEMVQMGTGLLCEEFVGSTQDILALYNVFVPDYGFTQSGYPTGGGSKAMAYVDCGIAISSQSSNQQAAWEFVQTLFSDSVQLNLEYGLPVTVSAMEQIVASGMNNTEDGAVPSTYWIEETEYVLHPLSEEQADNFRDILDSASLSVGCDSEILDIAAEEAAACFAGDKTALEVSEIIQSRVSIYLGETS